MDDKIKEQALALMDSVSVKSDLPPRIPIKLDNFPVTCSRLLACYGLTVRERGRGVFFDDNTTSKVEKVAKWLHDSNKRGLLLCGTLGNGKTSMLLALKRLLGCRATYIEAQATYEYFKQNRCCPYIPPEDVLLLDDLGVEPATYSDYGQIRYPVGELLMSRYKTNSTTVIATNCTFEQIGNIYGDRLHDRMKEMFAVLTYIEPSYRR